MLYLLSILCGVFLFCSNLNDSSITEVIIRTIGLYLALQSCCLYILTEIRKKPNDELK